MDGHQLVCIGPFQLCLIMAGDYKKKWIKDKNIPEILQLFEINNLFRCSIIPSGRRLYGPEVNCDLPGRGPGRLVLPVCHLSTIRPPGMSFSRESNTILIRGRNVFVALYVKNGSPGGSITSIINWPHCGDHEVARLRRSLNGFIAPIINIYKTLQTVRCSLINPNTEVGPSRRWPALFLRCHASGEVVHCTVLTYVQICHQVFHGLFLEKLVHRPA